MKDKKREKKELFDTVWKMANDLEKFDLDIYKMEESHCYGEIVDKKGNFKGFIKDWDEFTKKNIAKRPQDEDKLNKHLLSVNEMEMLTFFVIWMSYRWRVSRYSILDYILGNIQGNY